MFHWAPASTTRTPSYWTTGTPTFNSSIKKIGSYSLNLNNTTASDVDYVNYTLSSSTSYPWTIEFWLYVGTLPYPAADQVVFKMGDVKITVSPQTSSILKIGNYFLTNGTSGYGLSSADLTASTWIHVAMTKATGSTGIIRTYFNGIVDRYSATSAVTLPDEFRLGNINAGEDDFSFYIDEMRISNIARYSTNFTPSTSAFTTDANTVFLGHFENSLVNSA